MGKIMEAVFCIFYMIVMSLMGYKIVSTANNSKERLWFGIMAIVLVAGDAFHLVPRVLVAFNPAGDYHMSLGLGKMITSITMTFFYMIMYYVYSMRYDYKNKSLEWTMLGLSVVRIALCLLPQNDWTGENPVLWGIIRNIPFVIMGIIMVVLYYKKKDDKRFKWMWLAITLSYLFYLPVVLWSEVSPMIGMLMLPKTCMYIWAVAMGLKNE